MRAMFMAGFVLCSLILTSPSYAFAIHERRPRSKSWARQNRVNSQEILPVRIGLVQTGLEQNGPYYLMDVSDPASPNYGKHWSYDQVIEAFSPSIETVHEVKQWLSDEGISVESISQSHDKGWLAFNSSAGTLERILETHFYVFQHVEHGSKSIACDKYSIPEHLKHHIDYITPGVQLVPHGRHRSKRALDGSRRHPIMRPIPEELMGDAHSTENCDKLITPACIRALYEVPISDGKNVSDTNSLGIYETGDYYAQEDLEFFFERYDMPKIPIGTHPILDSVDGGKAPVDIKNAGIESSIDLQLAYPLIYPQTVTLYQVDDKYYASLNSGDSHTGQFNTFLDAIDGTYCNYTAYGETGDDKIDPSYPDHRKGGYAGLRQCGKYKPANVITISYGVQEDDLPAYYQKRQCNEFLKLGLQGVSILVASGDTGVAGVYGDNGHRDGCLGPQSKIFSPTEPNSCPWVTNVGATEIQPGKTVKDPEVAVKDKPWKYYSGGGFSNLFKAPEYQKAAIQAYFTDHKPPYRSYAHLGIHDYHNLCGRYNRIGRGIPDVAANGQNIAVYHRGKPQSTGGSSASSPIFASIINRIIEERIKSNKGPLGFLNPALYANPSMLNDVLNGSNPGCHTQGFQAVEGWDPVTGLGTPNYPRMRDFFLSLP